jgi:hypothetical protein
VLEPHQLAAEDVLRELAPSARNLLTAIRATVAQRVTTAHLAQLRSERVQRVLSSPSPASPRLLHVSPVLQEHLEVTLGRRPAGPAKAHLTPSLGPRAASALGSTVSTCVTWALAFASLATCLRMAPRLTQTQRWTARRESTRAVTPASSSTRTAYAEAQRTVAISVMVRAARLRQDSVCAAAKVVLLLARSATAPAERSCRGSPSQLWATSR